MNIGTGLEASVRVGMEVCSCGWVFVSADNTNSCHISLSCVLVHLLVPPQVGAFLPHVSSAAIPPVHQASSLLQPVCGSRVCVGVWVCGCVFGLIHNSYMILRKRTSLIAIMHCCMLSLCHTTFL